jgi:hypothetical protein
MNNNRRNIMKNAGLAGLSRILILCLLMGGLMFLGSWQPVSQQETPKKGKRPYELDWAGRFTDDHEPLVDFEDMEGWTVEASRGSAAVTRSEEQKIWGIYTGKIIYRGDTAGASFVIRPSEPVSIKDPFTAVNMWVWNDYWKWEEDRGKPIAKMSLLLSTDDGKSFDIPFCRELDWPGWYLLHIRLTAKQREAFANGGIFQGIRLFNCLLDEEESIFLDNLSFYQEDLTPLEYDVLPRPGVDLAPGQDLGVHTGEERLPFPTREETMLPKNVSRNYTTELGREGETFVFRYRGQDGVLEYRYKPQRGDLGDVTAQWMDGSSGTIRPMDNGGVKLKMNDEVEGLIQERFGTYIAKKSVTHEPTKKELLDCKISGEILVAKWKVSREAQSAVVEYVFRIWQKSLVTDVHCLGGEVGKVSLGKVSDAGDPELIGVPYWVGRPRVLLMGSSERPLYLTSFVDHYRTGSSRLYFENKIKEDGIYCGGGTHYIPKTNGKRNDCHERLFLTLSPRFEETLPTIPNPDSRWRGEAAKYLVCYYAVQDREADYLYWKNIARYGMNKIIMLDWETCWRDGAESFTFRTSAAPGKGGDENLQEYIRKVQDLGLRYSLYNNYVDFAPVNALWDEDMIIRMPTGGWQQAWFRTYSPKPAKVVKLSRIITSIVQDKFNPTAAGPDVHTAVSPWSRVDFDERMPGAGTMLTHYYSYGQLLLEQQEIWNGPVYSECGNNYYYSGLVTGSGACDHDYDFDEKPWLVDFYLRKMQPISCNWSLGYGDRTEEDCDRFFAKTIAFAMPGGFLGGWRHEFDYLMIRGYYMLQQLQSSYCQARIKDIRYANKKGDLLDVSTAIATGAHNRSQIRLEYDNGLIIWVNGHKEVSWKTPESDLPPSGYYARDPEGSLVVSSALHKGRRADYVHSPAYDYIDGRGNWFETPWAASDGQLIIRKNEDGTRELIPYGTEKFAVALDSQPKTTMGLDREGNEIGQTKGALRGGLYHIQPVSGAVSYVLKF